MSNRIENRLQELKAENKKALITYYTAGYPTMDTTKKIIKAQDGVTDVIEVGIPFSDPIADGPVIQEASYEAIKGGASLRKTFDMMTEIRNDGIETPIVFMMYYNTVSNYGIDDFVKKCHEVGVDGLIIPDLPMEEQETLKEALAGSDKTILIQLVAPVSQNRIPQILDGARGFVYCVSSMGVTGQSASFHKEVISYLKDVKAQSKIPVMMGFGIRKPADIEPMKDIIDGAIVGSHFINLIRESGFDEEAAKKYVTEFKKDL